MSEVANANTSEELREQIKALGAHIDAPANDAGRGLHFQTADTMQRASMITSMPLRMVVRQQALAVNFVLSALQMQRQLFNMWRPS